SVVNNCGSSVLTATGYTGALLWSTGATTPSITVTVPGIYSVKQTINGCTSPSTSVTAAPSNKTVPAPTIKVTKNCGGSNLTAIGFTRILQWSTGETTSSMTVATAGTYTVTQTVNVCTSAAAAGTAAPLISTVGAPEVS